MCACVCVPEAEKRVGIGWLTQFGKWKELGRLTHSIDKGFAIDG